MSDTSTRKRGAKPYLVKFGQDRWISRLQYEIERVNDIADELERTASIDNKYPGYAIQLRNSTKEAEQALLKGDTLEMAKHYKILQYKC